MDILFSKYSDVTHLKEVKPDAIFSHEVIAYLNSLSSILMKDRSARLYPDVATFAFFCRKGNIAALAESYSALSNLLGRGVVFHVTPSNVPVNFAYSLVAGLLAGNANIVRVPSKKFEQVDIIVNAIKQLSLQDEFNQVSERIALIRYERNGSETDIFSGIADVRVIWGGDETINQIRKSAIPPRSFDITFADRYSCAVIDAESIVKEANLDFLAEGFYNDTFLFDQNACSSPHLVIWLGTTDAINKAQKRFWKAFHEYVDKRYKLEPILAVNKLTAFYRQAIETDISINNDSDNTIWRVKLNSLPSNIDLYRCAGGYFSEFSTTNLDEIAPIISSKYQTLAYFGVDKSMLERFVLKNRVRGIDRVVPIGKTTDFALVWDGYDLIQKLSRRVSFL